MTIPTVDWLQQQRWFAAKHAAIEVGGAPSTPIGDGLQVSLVEASGERYQLVSDGERPDALDDPGTARALVAAMRAGRAASGDAGAVGFHLVPGVELGDGPVRPLGAEQSNTSLVVDERFVLKVFRRVQQGTNPELEVLRFLGEHEATGVPSLAGWYEVQGGPVDGTLGVLQALVPDATDGWRWILDRLPWRPHDTIGALHELGSVLAGLHRALGSGTVADGFGTVRDGGRGAEEIAAGIAADAEQVAATLPADRLDVRLALDGAVRTAEALAVGLDPGAAIRVHGDLHLGQLLVGPRGWTVIDWEGEPSRPLAERRTHQPALRDVAGLVRSLAYAVATVERSASPPVLDGWRRAARAALLDGYLDHADPDLLPPSASATRDLLELLELEKLVYEVGYEAANRPAWLDIPVGDLLSTVHGRAA